MKNNLFTKSLRFMLAASALSLLMLLSACSGSTDVDTSQDDSSTLPSPTATEPESTVPDTIAERMQDGFTLSINGNNISEPLSDRNVNSKVYITPSHTLIIESENKFSSIYIEWWTPPIDCSIVWDGGSINFDEESFLHDYISFPEGLNSVSIVSPESDKNALCNVELYTEGAAPDSVQDWLPPLQKADILVFPTHSDDDVIFFGPLISYYAIERGLDIQTAFMVEHAATPIRAHERLNGLWELGIKNYPILGKARDAEAIMLDEAMYIYKPYNIDEWQVEQIRRFRPSVIVGHDLNGEYGNGGHKVNAHYLTESIYSAADPEKFSSSAEIYGVWDCPKLYLHLYEENQIVLDVNTALKNDPLSRTPYQIAEDAMLCHVSQSDLPHKVAQEDAPYFDCRLFGLYRSLVGKDTGTDIMENIPLK